MLSKVSNATNIDIIRTLYSTPLKTCNRVGRKVRQ